MTRTSKIRSDLNTVARQSVNVRYNRPYVAYVNCINKQRSALHTGQMLLKSFKATVHY